MISRSNEIEYGIAEVCTWEEGGCKYCKHLISTISSSEQVVSSNINGNEVLFSHGCLYFVTNLRIVGLLCTVGEDVARILGYFHYSQMLPN